MSELVDRAREIKAQQVFQINDITLRVPPTNIAVQQEDLVYQAKALRTKTSTKTPSGHGSCTVQVIGVVTYANMLDLHRLAVEAQNSPFVFVENRIVRETIVPEWPLTQNMAFSIIGMSIAPMPGASDAMVFQLDLQWFNYSPFVHNFYYRREWATEWLEREDTKKKVDAIRKTIGWDIDPNTYERKPRTVLIGEKPGGVGGHREHDAVTTNYKNKTVRTLDEMELLHPGEFFDLLPMPDRMAPALPVGNPSDSLIYVRYGNYLQRDALLMNFGIDVEADLKEAEIAHWFFAVGTEPGFGDATYPLTHVPSTSVIYRKWRALYAAWNARLAEHQGGAEFAFCIYREIRMPEKWNNAVHNVFAKSAAKHSAEVGGEFLDDWFLRLDSVGSTGKYVLASDGAAATEGRPARIRVLPGMSVPTADTHVPIGKRGGSPSVGYATKKISSQVCWRDGAKVAELYDTENAAGRLHRGTDFGGDVGDPVYAFKPGWVRIQDLEPTELKFVDLRQSGSHKPGVLDLTNDDDVNILISIARTHWQNPSIPLTGDMDLVRGEIVTGDHWKEFIDSDHAYTSTDENAGIFVWREYKAGGINITMLHEDGSMSKYMHLSKVLATQGQHITADQVRAGYVIAELGATSGYSRKKQDVFIKSAGSGTGSGRWPKSVELTSDPTSETDYSLNSHLHFEYWEKPTPDRMPKYSYDDGLELVRIRDSGGDADLVPVQISVSLARATNQSGTNLLGSPLMPQAAARQYQDDENTLTAREVASISEQIDGLLQDGWQYYTDDTHVRNVWYKVIPLDVKRGNPDVQSHENWKLFRTDTLVLTNIGGGFRHVVSNIPVLGQEYPTQQHLGSLEPTYSFEFHSLDEHPALDGLSNNAQVMMGMRSVLQHNARKFRPIVDGWALSCNSFITRFFDSYRVGDVRAAIVNYDGDSEVDGWSLRRRLICNRATASTVEGNPGLSVHNLELSGTNPYVVQGLTSSGTPLEDQEKYYGQILRGLYNLDLDKKYAVLASQLLIAQLAGAEVSAVDDSKYGKVRLTDPGTGRGFQSLIGFARGAPGGDFVAGNTDDAPLYVKDPTGNYQRIFEETDRKVTRVSVDALGVISTNPAGDYIVVDSGATKGWKSTGATPTKDKTVAGYSDYSTTGGGAKSVDTYTDWGYVDYDIADILGSSQEAQLAAEVPWTRLMDLRRMVRDTLDAAEATIFEGNWQVARGRLSGQSLSPNEYLKGLYDLPSEPQGWRQLQFSLQKFAREFPPIISERGNYGLQYLRGGLTNEDINWLEFNDSLPVRKQDLLSRAFSSAYDACLLGQIGASIGSIAQFVPGIGWQLRAGLVAASLSPSVLNSFRNPVSGTVGSTVSLLLDGLEDTSTFFYGGPDLDGTKARIAGEIDAERWRLAKVQSAALPWSGGAITYLDSQVGSMAKTYIEPVFGSLDAQDNALASYSRRLRDAVNSSGMIGIGAIDGMPSMMVAGDSKLREESWRTGGNNAGDVKLPYSNWMWHVDLYEERRKLDYFKSLLARIARFAADDVGVMRALGLEFTARSITTPRLHGSPAYPDLVLPWHPYYGTIEQVSPDFYMWNLYQDGALFGKSVQDDMDRVLNHVVANSYQGMLRLQRETGPVTPGQGTVDLENYPESYVGFQPEGHDGSVRANFGPSTDAFYSIPADDDHIRKFFTGVGDDQKPGEDGIDEKVTSAPSGATEKQLRSRRAQGLRVGRAEGYFGGGGGAQYEARGTEEQYKQLLQIWEGFEAQSMFGHRAGFLKQKEGLDVQRLDGTLLGAVDEYKHTYSLASLQEIARQSARDLRTQKMMMRRAYPTFKLYFVEEDEYETRLLNFDDFHSYNSVISFSVVQDRKDAADHAIITVQNISGTLDGTRRNVITDLDYFVDETTTGRTRSGDDPALQDTDADQPFGAVVLRPGLNVQLRAGFSNNPEELEVLINGRVVDVTWNKQMDQAEIMVQSFGVELIQDIKGGVFGTESPDETPFYTTHELLGSLMMEPELTHFGRWEFAQRAQQGENNDYTLDFNDYSAESFLSKFGWSSWAVSALLDHPLLTAGLAIGGTALLARVGGGTWGVRNVLQWATRGNGAMARMLTARGVTAPITAAGWRTVLIDTAAARGAGALNGASTIGLDVVEQAVARNGNLTQIFNAVRHAGGESLELEARQGFGAGIQKLLDGGATSTLDEFAEVLAGGTASARTAVLRGQWFLDPVLTNQAGVWGGVSAVGGRPLVRAGWRYLAETPKYLLSAAGLGLGLDAMSNYIFDPLLGNTVGRAKKYWKLAKSRIMVSPQDDNLFVPHPKDYMVIPDATWTQMWTDFKDWAIYTGSRSLLFLDDSTARGVGKFLNGDILDKRVSPDAAQYRLSNTTIWDVFHEMSLRHPGWVYGTRPYGKEFRYTMFFGVPSQRYWARPGRNEFIDRINMLYDMISSGNGISKLEYQRLYGNTYNGLPLDDYDDALLEQAREYAEYNTSVLDTGKESLDFGPSNESPRASSNDPAVQQRYHELQQHSYGARALEEYLLGVETRFQPFRRYHSLHSDRDLVWNGIMGTENATYNAVDVTYWPEFGGDQPEGTAFFKAHGRIAPHKLRVRPLQDYRNVRGYQMAMRYAMGQMLHDMREMYRGEVIILGNPRIRPWDICILQDSYNDMAGPFEVERVVHTFSHETGYITELKPGALVFANEISGYPMLTAMKMMTLAIRDLEDTYVGLQHGTLDLVRRFLRAQTEGVVEVGGHDIEVIKNVQSIVDYIPSLLGIEGSNGRFQANVDGVAKEAWDAITENYPNGFSQAVQDGDLPNMEALDEAADGLYQLALILGGVGALGVGALTYKGTGYVLNSANVAPLIKNNKIVTQAVAGLAAGGITLAGEAGLAASVLNQISPLTIMWLLGGPLLMLNCLRGDSVIYVPLMKSGEPIAPSFSYRDPTAVWNDFKGELNRYIDDYVSGTRDVIDLYRLYGTAAWREVPDFNLLNPFGPKFGNAVKGQSPAPEGY